MDWYGVFDKQIHPGIVVTSTKLVHPDNVVPVPGQLMMASCSMELLAEVAEDEGT